MGDKPANSTEDKLLEALLKDKVGDEKQAIEAFLKDTHLAPEMQASAFELGAFARVKRTPETERLRLAGLRGTIFGQSLAVSKDEVIGSPTSKLAINVYFEHRDEQFWFAEDLVEPVGESD